MQAARRGARPHGSGALSQLFFVGRARGMPDVSPYNDILWVTLRVLISLGGSAVVVSDHVAILRE